MNPIGLLLVAIGVFSVCGAIFDWEWFMNHRKARLVSAILSRTGARIFYGLLGSGCIVFGILFALGIIKDAN